MLGGGLVAIDGGDSGGKVVSRSIMVVHQNQTKVSAKKCPQATN